jgi:L-ribulose-5-phosphate 3-epimerase
MRDISRRSVLQSGPWAAAVPAALAAPTPSNAQTAGPLAKRQRFAVSTYSYWHFGKEKFPIEKVIDSAAELGFDGVEILHRQMADESTGYMNKLKQLAFQHGLDLVMLSIHQDFVWPEAAERRKHIEHTEKCIDLAAQMGIPAIRLNSGRWKTIKSFDDLMKVKGNEPPISGHKEADAIKWCVDSIRECLPKAEKAGVMLALENHWGLTTSVDTLLKIWREVNSPWLGLNLDTGNFPGEPYDEFAKVAPHASIVQAKTYYGGGVWYTLDLDYKRIAGILKKANFKGYISLEMEGKEDAGSAVPKSLAALRAAFA